MSPGDVEIIGGQFAQPGSGPTVEIIDCRLLIDEEDQFGIPFEVHGVGVWSGLSKKYISLLETLDEEAIERAGQ